MGIRVLIEKGRLSFANGLWKASALEEGQTPKFGADFIIEEGTKIYRVNADGSKTPAKLTELMIEVANDTWKGKGKEMFEALEASKKCLRNGNTRMGKTGEVYAGYADRWYVTAKNVTRPTVINTDKTPLNEQDGKPYSGCYVNASIEIYGIADPKRKGVHASLRGVQFHSDGEAFGGGGVASADEFADLSDVGDTGNDFL